MASRKHIPKPVVIPASKIKSGKDLAKAVQYADKAPVVLSEASNLGFSSDQVLILKGKTSAADAEKVLASSRTPVLSQKGFDEVVKKGLLKK